MRGNSPQHSQALDRLHFDSHHRTILLFVIYPALMIPDEHLTPNRQALIDLDGFFRHDAEMRAYTPSQVLDCLPRTDEGVRKALILHSLFRSSLVLPGMPAQQDQKVLSDWSQRSLLAAVVEAARGDITESPDWLTFYADDLRAHYVGAYGNAEGSTVRLTLDDRLVAWAQPKTKEIHVSAIMREYLLRINVYLTNLVEGALSGNIELNDEESDKFFKYTMQYITRLHRKMDPSVTPVARPISFESFTFAQLVTQIQIEFLIAHEFGHIVINFPPGTKRSFQENECDTFAYERIAESGRRTATWFMSIRWLFELLALDRVVGEVLAFENGDWIEDIDWIQDDLRERRRITEILDKYQGTDNPALSAEETLGSMLLLDAKKKLCELGPQGCRELIDDVVRSAPVHSPEALADAVWNIMSHRSSRQGPNDSEENFEAKHNSPS